MSILIKSCDGCSKETAFVTVVESLMLCNACMAVKVCIVRTPTLHLHANCPGHNVAVTSSGNRFLDDKSLNKELWFDIDQHG